MTEFVSAGELGRVRIVGDGDILLKFGGGINSRASEDEIDARECADGQNFLLDLRNSNMRNRPPFDLVDTAPNAGRINGFVNFKNSDGVVTMLVQAGDTVYSFDGSTIGASVGTVSSSARLRGPLSQNWELDDLALVTDLALVEPVKEWNGTTLSDMTHNLSGDFKARYASVNENRAFYANVESNSTKTPHLLVGSALEDYDNLSVDDRPSSAIGAADPFYLTTLDLKRIRGLTRAFGRLVFVSGDGNIYSLTGSDSQDYMIDEAYAGAEGAGSEAFTYIGNDILYGRQGVIESIVATDKFGDVENTDPSVPIADQIGSFNDWTIVYNSRLQRVYCYPDSQAQIWVLDKPLLAGADFSPWSKWVTQHSSSFNPTTMMSCLDPSDGLEYVFFGDASGNLYRMEGTGTGDAGSADVKTERLSALVSLPLGGEAFDLKGHLSYRKNEAATVTIQAEYSGEAVFNESVSVTLPAISGVPTYGGSSYYGGTDYYGAAFSQRLTRQEIHIPGQANQFQIRITVEGQTDIEINELFLSFKQVKR